MLEFNQQYLVTTDQQGIIAEYCQLLVSAGFEGQLIDAPEKLSNNSLDNSIYEITPNLILCPATIKDLSLLLKIAQSSVFKKLTITARGSATGTNGQSLNTGIIVDCSKNLRKILNIDLSNNTVTVEPGVVLYQLNEQLKKHNKQFPIYISTANRATIGGMFNTNASGKGSRVYGRTLQQVVAVELINYQGSSYWLRDLPLAEQKSLYKDSWWQGLIDDLARLYLEHKDQIQQVFPDLNRGFTGYDLKNLFTADQTMNMAALACGAEGTLGLISQLTLKIVDIVPHKELLLVQHDSFIGSLSHLDKIIKYNPLAIETIDEFTLNLAMQDRLWEDLSVHIDSLQPNKPLHIIELQANCEKELQQQSLSLQKEIKEAAGKLGVLCFKTNDKALIDLIWSLRSRGVSLLHRLDAYKVPQAFIEDCVVPVANLAKFIKEFRELLASQNLVYGMYGHADVGCVHVRPAISLNSDQDIKLVRYLSDKVNDLVQQNGGLFWGEHGKGIRGEYAKRYLGQQLYQAMQQVKGWFDPHNKFNPGKLYHPLATKSYLYKIDQTPLKQSLENFTLSADLASCYPAISCDGNGECLSVNSQDLMCPSYKISHDRLQSPNGRARLLRQWLLWQKSAVFKERQTADYGRQLSTTIKESLDSCLACKACTGLCPLGVDIADYKSIFLNWYYKSKARPLADWLTANIEQFLLWTGNWPQLNNWFIRLFLHRSFLSKKIGLVDLPLQAKYNAKKALQKAGYKDFSVRNLQQNLKADPTVVNKTVIILPDAFLYFYEPHIIVAAYKFFHLCGYNVYLADFNPNGKGAYVKGYLQKFNKIANRHFSYLQKLAALKVPLISIEPSITLTYSQEYKNYLANNSIKIQSLEDFIVANLIADNKACAKLSAMLKNSQQSSYSLLGHCTQRACQSFSSIAWQKIFAKFKLSLDIAQIGCCGMAGIYGHQQDQQSNSQQIYKYSWQPYIEEARLSKKQLVVSGFSCRHQVSRFSKLRLQHPIEVLSKLL